MDRICNGILTRTIRHLLGIVLFDYSLYSIQHSASQSTMAYSTSATQSWLGLTRLSAGQHMHTPATTPAATISPHLQTLRERQATELDLQVGAGWGEHVIVLEVPLQQLRHSSQSPPQPWGHKPWVAGKHWEVGPFYVGWLPLLCR